MFINEGYGFVGQSVGQVLTGWAIGQAWDWRKEKNNPFLSATQPRTPLY